MWITLRFITREIYTSNKYMNYMEQQNYLGVDLDFSDPGKMIISMSGYTQGIFSHFFVTSSMLERSP